MTPSDNHLAFVRDPRLAPHVLAAAPAWLWSADAARLIWTNAPGAALLGEASPPAAAGRAFDRRHPIAREVVRLVGGLPVGGTVQLARLRTIAPGVGRALTCACSRMRSLDGASCVLIVSIEAMKSTLPLTERVRRTFTRIPDAVVFSGAGELLHANEAVRAQFGNRITLGALGADTLAAQAITDGSAAGSTAAGKITLERLGAGDTIALLTFLRASRDELAAPAVESAAPDVNPEENNLSEPARELHVETPSDGEQLSVQPESSGELDSGMASTTAKADMAAGTGLSPPAIQTVPSVEPTAAVLDDAEARLVERRHPLRFMWTIDAEGRFNIEPGEFTTLAGAPTVAVLGQPWQAVADALGLDPEDRVLRALGSRDTWSGITVAWPAEATAERLPVLLSGLPALSRDRSFSGYRGFGVCRDVACIAAVIAARRALLADKQLLAADGHAPEISKADAVVAPSAETPNESEGEPLQMPAQSGREPRPPLTLVPAAKNVVPLRAGGANEKRPSLSAVERNAFQEIARTLGARLETGASAGSESDQGADSAETRGQAPILASDTSKPEAEPATPAASGPHDDGYDGIPDGALERAVLDRLPLAVLVFRGDDLLFANRTLLEWTGFDSPEALAAGGGIEALFGDPVPLERHDPAAVPRALSLRSAGGEVLAVDARLSTIQFGGASAMQLVLARAGDERQPDLSLALQRAKAAAGELKSILDTATDGVIVVDHEGNVRSLNRSAEALFGYEADELVSRPFIDLFAPESQRNAADYLDGLTRSGVASLLNDGREVIGRVREGGLIPLFMTMGRIAEEPARFCAVFRDITQWKRAEEELTNARREAEKASSAKSDFLAKISHEIRTPLNAIIGFSEVMMEERFGPVGNERYRGYARDIHLSGGHMISLLNDLLDLSKIEAGKLDLSFTKVDLNDVMQQCVAIMQPQANRERIIIRTALSSVLPPVVADARSVRQIVLNLVSNSIKFTGTGGQVIVSTALTDGGEAVLRVRDTGIGMNEKDIATALEPFRQLPAASELNAAGTGLGLPLTKALAEANRAEFRIKSAVNTGTLVEIVFPATRVLSD